MTVPPWLNLNPVRTESDKHLSGGRSVLVSVRPDPKSLPIDLLVTTDEYILSVTGQEFRVPDGYERDSFVLPYPQSKPTVFALGPQFRWSSVGEGQTVCVHPFAQKSYEQDVAWWAEAMPNFDRNDANASNFSGPHAFVSISRHQLLSMLATIPDESITLAVPIVRCGEHDVSTGHTAFGTGSDGSSFFCSMLRPDRYLGVDKSSRRTLSSDVSDLDKHRIKEFVGKVAAEFAWTLRVIKRIGELAQRAKAK